MVRSCEPLRQAFRSSRPSRALHTRTRGSNETNVPTPRQQANRMIRPVNSAVNRRPPDKVAGRAPERGYSEEGSLSVAGQRRAAIRIGIVDDHPVFRLGLKHALERESDLEITWEMGSAAHLDAGMPQTPT